MKHPEYDSPFEMVISNISTQMARDIDEMSWQAIQRVGIDVDKEKLLTALRQDDERYREAYKNGYDTGYEKRDDDIVRCKDCIHWDEGFTEECGNINSICFHNGWCKPTWFCADGERKEGCEVENE